MSKPTHPTAPVAAPAIERVNDRLKICFALLSGLGGLALASGPQTEAITFIAVFFAIFGYVCVDWLRLFALPPVAAYAAMGVSAAYCIVAFTGVGGYGEDRMVAVARLLVYVQAILMLQQKNRRIFEQLAVFCLLELIIAAVFTDALQYAVWLMAA